MPCLPSLKAVESVYLKGLLWQCCILLFRDRSCWSNLAIAPGRRIRGQPVLALTPWRRALGRVITIKPRFNPFWTHLPQIILFCDLYCVKETTARLVCCNSFLSNHTVTMSFLLLPGRKKKSVTAKAQTSVGKKNKNKTYSTPEERLQIEYSVTSYLVEHPEWSKEFVGLGHGLNLGLPTLKMADALPPNHRSDQLFRRERWTVRIRVRGVWSG